jgi:hypothetical protein
MQKIGIWLTHLSKKFWTLSLSIAPLLAAWAVFQTRIRDGSTPLASFFYIHTFRQFNIEMKKINHLCHLNLSNSFVQMLTISACRRAYPFRDILYGYSGSNALSRLSLLSFYID